MKLTRLPFNLDGIDIEENIVATYYLETPFDDITPVADAFAKEQSTGTWTEVPIGNTEMVEKRTAKVTEIRKLPVELEGANACYLQMAFPTEIIPPEFSTLLASVTGNIMMFTRNKWAIKLTDIRFPEPWLSNFEGPQFGIEGIRKELDISERPLINNMIKPCTGHDVDTHVELFREAAYGGIDLIKDDELLTNPEYNPFFERIERCMEVIKEKEEETGEKTLYTANVTGPIKDLRERARKAVEKGANALMLDSSVGLSGLRMLTEDPEIDVPFLYHPDFLGNICAAEKAGIDMGVYAKMSRIAGADIIFTTDYRGKFPGGTKDLALRGLKAVTQDLHDIPKAMPFVTGGGVHPGVIPGLVGDYGKDIMIGVGGGLHGHPDGPRAGGKALRQAVDAAVDEVPLSEAAEEHPELQAALDKWGIIESSQDAEELYETR